MSFRVVTRQQENKSRLDGTIVVLEDPKTGDRAEVWPALGFNCLTWQTRHEGQPVDLLYVDPQLFDNGRPTRSGIPVLFPFPNRIRDGKFTWEGKTYQLPLNDAVQRNAIHGFVCRKPWRLVERGATNDSAYVTAEFQGSREDPDSRSLWPADYVLRLTYELSARRLVIRAEVRNPDKVVLPFGLGYHPYFRVPLVSGNTEPTRITVPAAQSWELQESLPTGRILPVAGGNELRSPRKYEELQLDELLTGIEARSGGPEGLVYNGSVQQGPVELQVWSAPEFAHLVVFTPPHRQAFCIEPYTCINDAVNLQGRGLPDGLLTLEPGATWQSTVQLQVS